MLAAPRRPSKTCSRSARNVLGPACLLAASRSRAEHVRMRGPCRAASSPRESASRAGLHPRQTPTRAPAEPYHGRARDARGTPALRRGRAALSRAACAARRPRAERARGVASPPRGGRTRPPAARPPPLRGAADAPGMTAPRLTRRAAMTRAARPQSTGDAGEADLASALARARLRHHHRAGTQRELVFGSCCGGGLRLRYARVSRVIVWLRTDCQLLLPRVTLCGQLNVRRAL